MKNRIENQHYVPRYYFEQFLNKHGKIDFFDKFSSTTGHDPPKKIASQHYFYDVKATLDEQSEYFQLFERELSKAENLFAQAQRRVLKTRVISHDDKQHLSYFIAIQYLRTPAARMHQQQVANMMTNYLLGLAGINDVTVEAKPEMQVMEQISLIFGDTSLDIAMALYPHIWVILSNDTRRPFLTSDSPVVKRAHVSNPNFGSDGFASEGIEVIFPISKNYVLWLRERTHFQSDSALDGCVVEASDAQISELNDLQITESHQYVFSSNNDFTRIYELLKADPSLTKPRTYEIDIVEHSNGMVQFKTKQKKNNTDSDR
jgi:hypothetical protein